MSRYTVMFETRKSPATSATVRNLARELCGCDTWNPPSPPWALYATEGNGGSGAIGSRDGIVRPVRGRPGDGRRAPGRPRCSGLTELAGALERRRHRLQDGGS